MENNISAPTMLTIKETAKKFKLSEYFLRRGVNEGQIVAIRAGRKILINAEKLAEYLNNNTLSNAETLNTKSYKTCSPINTPKKSYISTRPYITPISKK